MREPIVFFGTEAFSTPALEALIKNDWPIRLVVTKPDAKRGRGQRLSQPAVKRMAQSYGIDVIQPQKLHDAKAEIEKTGCRLAALVAYGKLVPQAVIEIFEKGIVNVHPSKLPKYRGAAPIEHTILNGDEETAVTLMKLVLEMDAGPVFASRKVKLSGQETQSELYEKLSKVGAELLIHTLPQIAEGKLEAEQQRGEPTFAPKFSKEDGVIDWNNPAIDIERKIRAFEMWPKAKTELAGKLVSILQASVVDKQGQPGKSFVHEGKPAVFCANDSLVIEELQPSGKSRMSGKAFLAGNEL